MSGMKASLSSLGSGIKEVFNKTLDDYDLMFIVHEVPDAKRDELQEQISDFVSKAKATLDGPVQDRLEEASGHVTKKRKAET